MFTHCEVSSPSVPSHTCWAIGTAQLGQQQLPLRSAQKLGLGSASQADQCVMASGYSWDVVT